MSSNPFTASAETAERIAALRQSAGDAITAAVTPFLGRRSTAAADNLGGVIPRDSAAKMVARHGLSGTEELMLLALPAAETMARPPISGFFVGAVGLEAETGNLILGGNVEFPGTHLGTTVHGEGFVATRAFSRGTALAAIAIGEAHPCAHCRQYLSEFAATSDLVLIDPLGHRLRMADLYPWPFDPGYLGDKGALPEAVPWPALRLARNDLEDAVATRLLEAGRRAHAPYSKCPGAVALLMRDGAIVAGSAIESVAFNPTMGPLQAALIDLLAHGYSYDDIAGATLGTVEDGAVDYSRSTAELLAAVAPGVRLAVAGWVPW